MVYIGEGSFGCVYRPAIKCKNGTKYKTGKISKLMTRKYAKKEIDEYKLVKKADKKGQYYLGPPKQCEIDPVDALNEMSYGECKLFEKNPNILDYKLLIYDDGGYDLDIFVKTIADQYLASDPKKQMELFFLNARNLFLGVKQFLDNDLVHHDIKPQNIVFDSNTYRFNYIDFGIAEKKSTLISRILAETDYENFHWSYPFESGFLNHYKPYYFKKLNPQTLSYYQVDFTRVIEHGILENQFKIKPSSFNSFFKYAENKVTPYSKTNYVKNVFIGLNIYLRDKTYEDLVEDVVNTIDIHSLGFTMNYMLNMFYDKNIVSRSQYISFSNLFQRMCNPNLVVRVGFTIDDYLAWYDQILTSIGIQKPLVQKPLVQKPLVQKPCPEGKERNPETNRCRKIVQAKADHAKADHKSIKPTLKKVLKPCPEGKERNPETNRCRKIINVYNI